jgi:hypothetical protein
MDTVHVSRSAPTKSSSNDMKFGVGLTAYGGSSTSGGLSGLIEIDDKMAVQPFLGLGYGAVTGFSFGLGGMFKYTLVGGRDAGLHVGGGLSLGAGGAAGAMQFLMNLYVPNAGIHFTVADRVRLSLDGGITVSINAGGGTAGAGVGLGPLSSLLGASVHYMF